MYFSMRAPGQAGALRLRDHCGCPVVNSLYHNAITLLVRVEHPSELNWTQSWIWIEVAKRMQKKLKTDKFSTS